MGIKLSNLLNRTWCLQQTLMGCCWLVTVRGLLDREAEDIGVWQGVRAIRYKKLQGGVSLGPFLFYQATPSGDTLLYHEYGHYRHSLLLGLPSFSWAIMKKAGFFQGIPYCAFPTAAAICQGESGGNGWIARRR
ncbi:MAG: hypothetical protein AB2552_01915 [Candidatus Thiodiazotropha endolucinida]